MCGVVYQEVHSWLTWVVNRQVAVERQSLDRYRPPNWSALDRNVTCSSKFQVSYGHVRAKFRHILIDYILRTCSLNVLLKVSTRSSAVAEKPRDASYYKPTDVSLLCTDSLYNSFTFLTLIWTMTLNDLEESVCVKLLVSQMQQFKRYDFVGVDSYWQLMSL